jgi:hypothetical protein
MRSRVRLALAFLFVSCIATAVAQSATPPDGQVFTTLLAGLKAREVNLPPLALCGVWRGFYTLVHWRVAEKVISDPERFERLVKGDRAAVALALWEGANRDEWVREVQGVYRGPNKWVYPKFPGDARFVSDLYRLERGTRERTVVLDLSVNGYPWLTVKAPSPGGVQGFVGSWLGLNPGFGPLSEDLARAINEGSWRLAPIQRNGTVFTVREGFHDPQRGSAAEIVVELDSGRSFAPLRYRHLAVTQTNTGYGHEFQFDEFSALQPDGPFLPASAVRWEFDYKYSDLGPLADTQTFTCLALAPTDPAAPRSHLPRCAYLDDDSSAPVPMVDVRECMGARIWHALRNFAEEQAPEPPDDLMQLDPPSMLAEIKARYGFE